MGHEAGSFHWVSRAGAVLGRAGGHRLGTSDTALEAAGLVVEAVGARDELAVGARRWEPGLEVVLAGGSIV